MGGNNGGFKYLPLVFHTTVCLHHIYISKFTHEVDFSEATDPRILIMERYSYRYFTSWNMIIQTMYFGMTLLQDVLKLTCTEHRLSQRLSTIKGYIFTAFMFPFTLFVTGMFWSVYNINRDWVLPEAADAIFPSWFNHSLHTNIMVFLVIETLISNNKLPSFKTALTGISIITVIYDIMFFLTYYESGKFLYGIFHVLQWHERILFMVINYFAVVLSMRLGIIIQQYKSMGLQKMKLL